MRSTDKQAQPVRHQAAARKLSAELRRHLQSKLPDYMIPAAFVILEELPLTQTGKVDRRALPAIDLARPELAVAFVPPRNPTEEALAGIWRQVLGVDRVGVGDNFFELGGHSLLATQIISRIRRVFQAEVPLRVLFESPTVARLAQWIEQNRPAQADAEPATILPAERAALAPEELADEAVEALLRKLLEAEQPEQC